MIFFPHPPILKKNRTFAAQKNKIYIIVEKSTHHVFNNGN